MRRLETIQRRIARRPLRYVVEWWSTQKLWWAAEGRVTPEERELLYAGGDVRTMSHEELVTRLALRRLAPRDRDAYRALHDGIITPDEFVRVVGPRAVRRFVARGADTREEVATLRRLARLTGTTAETEAALDAARVAMPWAIARIRAGGDIDVVIAVFRRAVEAAIDTRGGGMAPRRDPSAPLRAVDRIGRTLVGTITPDADGVRATIAVEGHQGPLLYDKRFPTIVRATIALKASLGVRSAPPPRRRRARVRVGRRPGRKGDWLFFRGPDGRRMVKYAGDDHRRAKELARSFEDKLLRAEAGLDTHPGVRMPSFEAYAETVIAQLRKTAAPDGKAKRRPWTVDQYERVLAKYALPRFGARRLDTITRREVANLVEDLRGRGLAPASVRVVLAVVALIFTRAVQAELLTKHPARDLDDETRDLLRGTRRPGRFLTPEELARLLDDAKATLRFDRYVYLLTLAHTGLRRGEAAGLKVGDLDLDAGTATVRRSVRRDREGGPKSGKARSIHLTTELVDALRELLHQRRVVAFDEAVRAGEWVFVDKRGHHLNVDAFKHDDFDPVCARVGLPGLRLHDLRHTWASIHLRERTELHEIQQRLGHQSPAITLAVYGHLMPGDRRETMDRFSAALARARKD